MWLSCISLSSFAALHLHGLPFSLGIVVISVAGAGTDFFFV